MAVNAIAPIDASSGFYYQPERRPAPVRSTDRSSAFALLQFTGANALTAFGQAETRRNADDILDNASLFNVIPEVLDYFDRQEGGNGIVANPIVGNTGFVLTDAQQMRILAIIEKYKEDAVNEETYARIQADLTAEGLSAEQLAVQSQLQSFDPSARLLDSLESPSSSNLFDNIVASSDLQARIDGYNQQILNLWLGVAAVPQGSVINLVA